ncbi:MAG: amphi-Trp domain-containing protein [Syntrophales bacterium]|jgi:amphi-Trp domain-containing protein|nr:amphi-Trp domain-containing protein [Syntrophales bacterium]MCK9392106.1 amphi-Trp domain-containing protein [Syntrophales bacterium]
MEEEKTFQHESVEDKDSIVKYLQTLSEGFRKRKLEFQSGQEKIVLEPAGLIQVEIKVKNRSRKSKISLKFTWKDQPARRRERHLSIESSHE